MNQMLLEGRIRRDILDAAHSVEKIGAHLAPSLSIVEILTAVFSVFDRENDSFILSKGHGALGYYAAMHQFGWITEAQFRSFEEDGGNFPGQPSKSSDNMIEYSSGSLGMGLSYAIGVATIKKKSKGKVFVIMGDGEANEGSVWEASALAAQLNLNNIVVLIDRNGLQSDGRCNNVLQMNLINIWDAYSWNVLQCDGHSTNVLIECIIKEHVEKPTVIISNTIKGKGVSFMENNNDWHHHTLNDELYTKAISELEEQYGIGEKQ